MSATWRTLALLDGLRRHLDDIVDQQTRDLTRAWVDAWNEIEPDLRMALLEQLVPGQRVSRGQLTRSLRLRNALLVVADRLERLADQAGVRIKADLQDVIDAAGTAQAAVIDSQLPPGSHLLAGLDQWSRVDPAQIEAMVARVTQQITSLSRPISAETYKAMRAELLRGIAAGSSPRQTADRMLQRTQGRFTGGLTRALVISRTEMLDAHRSAAALAQARHADVLTGWTWLTHLDARTCRGCLSMAGRLFPLTEPGPHGHQQCRCARMPQTKTWRELGFDIDEPPDQTPDPDAWFRTLTPAEQRRILGADGYQAWLAGDFPREAWARRRENDGWRDSYVPADPGGPNAAGDGTIPPPRPPANPGKDPGGGQHNLGDTLRTNLIGDDARAAVQDAIATIARVHGVDVDMPQISVLEFEEPMRSGGQTLGGYSFKNLGNDPNDPTSEFGDSVAMRMNLLDADKVATLVHELGHFLDHKGIGDPGFFASATDPALTEWRAAVLGSDSFRTLKEMLQHDRSQPWASYLHQDGRTRVWNPNVDYVAYLMDPREAFARSYSQWIALRSGDEKLMRQILDTLHAKVSPGPGWMRMTERAAGHPGQWDPQDFEAIATAFDRLFDSMGLLRRQR